MSSQRPVASSASVLRAAFATRVVWLPSGDVFAPWHASVGGQAWTLRLNDFPEERLYTLFVAGLPVGDFDDFPPGWSKAE